MKNILIIKYLCCLVAVGMLLQANANSVSVETDKPVKKPDKAAFVSTISATNGCDCSNSDNYTSGSTYHFAETVVIEGDAGDSWTVDMNYSVGMVDASGNFVSGPIAFTETSPGVYELNFWHKHATGYGIHAYNSAGSYLSINDVCYDYCSSSCSLDAGLVVGECVSDDRFTFTLDPSGAGFSGTYNVVGDVVSYGVTGTYTSPPLLSDEGNINVTIFDATDGTCGLTFDVVPPACAALSIFALNNCACDHEDNYQSNGSYFLAETVGILGDPGDTWTVDMNFTVGLYDASGNQMTAPLAFTETSPGVYELNFWHRVGVGYGIHTYDSAGEYGSINNVCWEECPPLCTINDGLIVNDCLPGDRFTFTLNPTGNGFSGTYNLSGDVNATGLTGSYTSAPTLATAGNLNVTITDAADSGCSLDLEIVPPACASEPCSITDFGLIVGSCTAADRFIFTLNPSGPGFSGTYHMSGDINLWNVTGPYTTLPALTNVGDLNVTITDAANPYCSATVYITPPDCDTNTCSIDDFGLIVKECVGEDKFTYSLNPSGLGFSGTYNLNGDANVIGVTGVYNSLPTLANVGLINVTVTDMFDPSCSRTVYIAPLACAAEPCSIDDFGLVINGCVPGEDKFTFSLNPSGPGFSGTYHMSGDINLNNVTGVYNTLPAWANVGDINVTVIDAANPSCNNTIYIPPPACGSIEPVIAASNPCDCTGNFEANGNELFAENVGILGAAGDTWTVDFSYSIGLYDASGAAMGGTVAFTETSAGVYELDFWHILGAGYGLHVYNSTGEYLSLNGVCLTSCPGLNNDNLRISPAAATIDIAEIFPNPGNGTINIRFDSDADYNAKVVVMDLYGKQQMLVPVNANSGANLVEIDSGGLPDGSYFILIEGNNRRSTPKRFVKVK